MRKFANGVVFAGLLLLAGCAPGQGDRTAITVSGTQDDVFVHIHIDGGLGGAISTSPTTTIPVLH